MACRPQQMGHPTATDDPMLLLALLTQAHAVETTVLANTTVPMDLGVRGRVEVPGRVQLGVGVGYLPTGYVGVINGVAMAFDAYGEGTADIISFAIQQSLVTSLDVGWRPGANSGFRFGAGYSLVTLGGNATGSELLAAAVGVEAPSTSAGRRTATDYDLGTTLHLLRPEVGWTVPLGDRLVLDLGVGGLFTLASRATVAPFDGSSNALQDSFSATTEIWLEDTLETWVHSPTLTVGFGARFGTPAE